ncbi:MAG: sensor histidine kinase [Betaproteobacteria bacterium]
MSGANAPSIQTRLLRRTLATVLLWSVISAAAGAFAVSFQVRTSMESALEEAAQALVVLAEHESEVEAISHGRALPSPPHQETLQWQLRASTGRLVARSHSAPDEPWPAVPLVEGHQRGGGLAVYTIPGQDLWLQVAVPLAEVHRAQYTAAAAAGGTVLALGLAACAILAWAIRQELRPIADFARAIESIGPDTVQLPSPRLPRSELARAYSELGAMLGRLRAKLQSERAFSAHAAHSLRTPLAGLSAQLEVAGAIAPPEVAQRIGMAAASAHRLVGVVEALLSMARTTDGLHWRQFDATELSTVAAGRGIEVDASQLVSAGVMRGDSDLLAVAVANLVDNAARHGARRVRLQVACSADQQSVEVKDDGPGVAKEALERLAGALERFGRSGKIDSALGLGLTLAATVARAHGGHLSLGCAAADGHGFCVRLTWPAAHAPVTAAASAS